MGLFENIQTDRVSELACREPVLVRPDQPIREVVEAMREGGLGCAVLVDDEQRPKGVFVERTLTQLLAGNPEALNDPVSDHVEPQWPQVSINDPIASVLKALVTSNTRFLPVVDDEGKVIKLTGQKGLMEFIADHFPDQVTAQRVGQKPYMQEREGA